MKKSGKITIAIRLDAEQWQEFDDFASRHAASRNELISAYIDECLSGKREPAKKLPKQGKSEGIEEAVASLQAKVAALEEKLNA